MSYYRLIEHRRRRAAASVEPDVVQRVFGVLLYVLLVIGACWVTP